MHLASGYRGMTKWTMVYHTSPGSNTVEMVRERFFKSEKAAWKWFDRKFKRADFIDPEAVRISGFERLQIESHSEGE